MKISEDTKKALGIGAEYSSMDGKEMTLEHIVKSTDILDDFLYNQFQKKASYRTNNSAFAQSA